MVIPRAYVVIDDDATREKAGKKRITEEDILNYVYDRVAPYKRLRGGVRFVKSVPRSPAGKLLRRVQIEIDREENK
jgi:4-coumarate--CoA ligase